MNRRPYYSVFVESPDNCRLYSAASAVKRLQYLHCIVNISIWNLERRSLYFYENLNFGQLPLKRISNKTSIKVVKPGK